MVGTLDNQRASARAATNHLAGIAWRGGVGNARVIDISMTGARIATHEMLMIGESVVLTTVRMGARPGTIVRAEYGEYGIHFTDDLAKDVEAGAQKP